jgi:glutamine phosphoribosylpyrophosphate amidotransferase
MATELMPTACNDAYIHTDCGGIENNTYCNGIEMNASCGADKANMHTDCVGIETDAHCVGIETNANCGGREADANCGGMETDGDCDVVTASAKMAISPKNIFQAVRNLHKRVRGGYAVVAMVPGGGIIAFRDPFGIRPLVFGTRATTGAASRTDFVVASESVVIDALAFELVRDVQPGEAIYIDCDGEFHSQMCHDSPSMSSCIFEYVYMARPDSVIDGVSVYASRLRMGERLAAKIKRVLGDEIGGYSVVMPVPDTSRPSALQCVARREK